MDSEGLFEKNGRKQDFDAGNDYAQNAGMGEQPAERRVVKVRRGRPPKNAALSTPETENAPLEGAEEDVSAANNGQGWSNGGQRDASYEKQAPYGSAGSAAPTGSGNYGNGYRGGDGAPSYGGGNGSYGNGAADAGYGGYNRGGEAAYGNGYSRGGDGTPSYGGNASYGGAPMGGGASMGGGYNRGGGVNEGNYNESRAPRQQRPRSSNYGDNSRQGGQHYNRQNQTHSGRDNERGGSGDRYGTASFGSGVYSFNAGGVSAAAINGVVANTLENSPVNFIPPPERFPRMPDVYGKPDPLPDEAGGAGIPRLMINELSRLNMMDLRELASNYGISNEDLVSLKKQEIIFALLKIHTERGGVIYAYGSLEILSDGYGFLRSPQNSYLPSSDDIYISQSQIRLFALKTGDTVYGQIRSPKDTERFFAMLRVETVNYQDPSYVQKRIPFDNLTPLYPEEKLDLETAGEEISTRIINIFSPIGKGQRSIIVAPPRTGKTIMLQKIANSITKNHPEVYLIVLLIDERPEEVTDMERTVRAEVISSTFDEQASRHVQVTEMALEKAKRLVEHKRDVVILLDSITRLARAYNQTVPTSGKILSGGVDSNALHKPKRFFGAARNIEEGGSLTIISTALVETGSRMDEVIFEEFKGTGNMEIQLDRKLADRRLYPAINIKKSGTRKEELLLTEFEMKMMWVLRKFINNMEDSEIIELLLDRMPKAKDNDAFLRSMNTD